MTNTAALLRKAADEINNEFYERREVIEVLLITLLARGNHFMLGVPGVAKSELTRRVAKIIKDAVFYDVLFDTQIGLAEYFGQWDPILYKQKNLWRRNTMGKAPRAHIFFGDEEGKAGPNVLNPLLTLINEHKFHNGCSICGMDPYKAAPHECDGQPADAPLLMFVGASNEELELPKLEALWDRKLTRMIVQPIQESGNFRNYLRSKVVKTPKAAPTQVDLKDLLHAIEVEVPAIDMPESIEDKLMQLRADLKGAQIEPSDRRWGQCVTLLQATAYYFGRDTVDEEDLTILQHALWDTQDQIPAVTAAVLSNASTTTKWALETLVELGKLETRLGGMDGQSADNMSRVGADINLKLGRYEKQYDERLEEAKTENRSTVKIEQVFDQIIRLRIRVAVELLGMPENKAHDRYGRR
jgi:MoxR-like ATPase